MNLLPRPTDQSLSLFTTFSLNPFSLPQNSLQPESLQPKPLPANLDEQLIEAKRVCYTVVMHGLYQHCAEIANILYLLQKGTSI